MKTTKYSLVLLCAWSFATGLAQNRAETESKFSSVRELTIEPGLGIHINSGTDLLISNLVQWNPRKRISLASHTSFNINNITQRDFNYVKTEYNYTINQKFGVGTTFYFKKSSHTFLLMAGVKRTAFKETLNNPNFNQVSATITSVTPDYGLMYSLKRGWKKYFFTSRIYIPLYPWPLKGPDINYADGNMNNIALEFGVGMKIK